MISQFNHPNVDHVNYVSTDLSAQMIALRMMVKTVVDRVVDSDHGSSFIYCPNINIILRTGRLYY